MNTSWKHVDPNTPKTIVHSEERDIFSAVLKHLLVSLNGYYFVTARIIHNKFLDGGVD